MSKFLDEKFDNFSENTQFLLILRMRAYANIAVIYLRIAKALFIQSMMELCYLVG